PAAAAGGPGIPARRTAGAAPVPGASGRGTLARSGTAGRASGCPVSAARTAVLTDPQFPPCHPGRPQFALGGMVETFGNVHQGEAGEDRDPADLVAAQTAFTGDGPHDVPGAHPIGVPHGDAVDGPLGGGAPGVGRSAGAVCATPIPPVTGGGGLEVPLEDILLAARGGPGIADVLGEQRSGRGEQILAVLLGEQVPVHLQASGLARKSAV